MIDDGSVPIGTKFRESGKGRQGSRHGNAKLAEWQVLEARMHHEDNGFSIASLARYFGVSYSVMHSAIKRVTWRHVP